jgi:Cof subfamily protein (haloacid dehalogenase superfamily)
MNDVPVTTDGQASAAPTALVALDIDGTLLTPDHHVAPSTKRAVAVARQRGVRLILASSRGPAALESIQAELGLGNEWFIAYQGALVARRVDDGLQVLSDTPLDHATARSVEARAIALGLSTGRYIGSRWRVPRMTVAIEHEAAITGEKPLLSAPEETEADLPPQKVLVIADGASQIARLRELFGALPPTVSATFSKPNYLEITAAGVDKSHGLRPLLTHLGIPMARTAAIGDGHNDLALFATVDYPIAMGQAPVEVAAAARWITSTNTDDGVARALEHLGLVGAPPRQAPAPPPAAAAAPAAAVPPSTSDSDLPRNERTS